MKLYRTADLAQKFITGALAGFTVLGVVNMISMYNYKKRRNARADELLEEATRIDEL
jgi:hypothetical protein